MRTLDLETTGLGFESVLVVEVATFSSQRCRDSSGTGRLEGRCAGKSGVFKLLTRDTVSHRSACTKAKLRFAGCFTHGNAAM